MDDLENKLAEGIEDDHGIKAMAAKLAPRSGMEMAERTFQEAKRVSPTNSVEAKLQAIEKLIAEIRVVSSQIKSQLG